MICVACIIALIALTSTAQGQNRSTTEHTEPRQGLYISTNRTCTNVAHRNKQNLDKYIKERDTWSTAFYHSKKNLEKSNTSRPSCDGYCLNGGRCQRTRSVRVLRCRCPRGYIGNRCETRRVPCPEIDPRPSGKCKGKLCSDDRVCVKPGEQCCHNSCGRKLCTNISGPGQQQNMTTPRIRTNAERRKIKNLNKDGMTENKIDEKIIYTAANGRYGVEEDPNSPSCKGFCLNGGRCVRNFPENFISCNCHIHYKGKRCENSKYSCPEIVPRSDGKCEGTSCSINRDCVKPQEECCPSACGGKICANVNTPSIRPCDGYCLNGGRCWQSLPDPLLFCYCPKGYTGKRCETLRGSCPEIYLRSDGKCEGNSCSNDQDCYNPGEQCCPSDCGEKLCTNVIESDIWTVAVRQRKQKLDSMVEHKEPEGFMYYTENGTWGVSEDRNSPFCKGYCLNGGQCVRNFPDDVLSCNCHIYYTGERCENYRYSCPKIVPRSDGNCEGTSCSIDHDCVNPQEECCPSACGGKICTNVNPPILRQRSCDGYCLNGGQCRRSLPDDVLICNCPDRYTGNRCETFTGFCPRINFISVKVKCEGQICSNDQDCVNSGEHCCPNDCGEKLCTRDKPSVIHYPCLRRDFCFHGARCWSFRPGGAPNCNCPIGYHGIRCEERNRQ